ncbi:MAG: hypothetical protein HY075_14135 [Deltaproteobacteria bacterium]|nr:hypothetical protein [Deltaproteobacteria bacterium]
MFRVLSFIILLAVTTEIVHSSSNFVRNCTWLPTGAQTHQQLQPARRDHRPTVAAGTETPRRSRVSYLRGVRTHAALAARDLTPLPPTFRSERLPPPGLRLTIQRSRCPDRPPNA